jgi:hypothetical protein
MTAASLNNLAGKSIVLTAFVGVGGSLLAKTITPFSPMAGFVSGATIGATYLPFQYLLEKIGLEQNETVKMVGFVALQIFNTLTSNRLYCLGEIQVTFMATLVLNAAIIASAFLIQSLYNYIYES